MTRCNGSIVGPINEPTNTAAGGVWRLREAATYLQADEWPSQPAVPPAPTAVAGNAQVSLSWTAASGNSPVADYGIEYSSNSGSTWTTFSDGVSTATSAVVTGLTNGTSYIFRLVAINPLGEVYGSASASVTPVAITASLLMHFDGSNGSTTFTDSSENNASVTPFGDAAISTAEKQFGSASGRFDGAGDYLSIPADSSLNFGTGDYTIEMWVRFDAVGAGNQFLGGQWSSGQYAWSLAIYGSVLAFSPGSNGSNQAGFVFTDAPTAATWHHIAITRHAGVRRHFLDGVFAGSDSDPHNMISTSDLVIGQNGDGGGSYLSGYIDELRIVKGTAIYDTDNDFTPPSAPFTP